MDALILIPIVLPIVSGILLLVASFREHSSIQEQSSVQEQSSIQEHRKKRMEKVGSSGTWQLPAYVCGALGISVAGALAAAWTGEKELILFTLLDSIPIQFHIDAVGRLFVTVVSLIWLAALIYGFVYMKHEGEEKRYYGFYLILYGVLVGLDFSGNLVTMYLFYELMTLVSMPLVLHNGSREAIMAALKYLFYSICGAYGGLFGIFVLNRYCDSFYFTAGGILDSAAIKGHEGILLAAVFVMLVGFGAKAGMLPLHAWLPTAHPVAPSPASAVLSAIIVKSGVLAVIRVVYYIVGANFLRGTWVQYAWMTLTLLTVFMGSMLAFREQTFKKRLAYSTVSQVSYILFGLALMTTDGFTGALLHVVVHAIVKCGLFLTAGVFLYRFGYTKVEQLVGIGKKLPKTMWCYLFFSLALVGIPPTGGFISKWYLAQGALESGIGIYSWLGPVVLLVSALLTAGYLLPVAMKGFFPGQGMGDYPGKEDPGKISTEQECPGKESTEIESPEAEQEPVRGKELSYTMLIPLMILAALAVLTGVFPSPLIQYASEIAKSVL